MAVTAEQLKRIATISAREHGHIVDSFSTLGRDPETIAIRQGIDLEDVINILHAYDLNLGSIWGDEEDDRGTNHRVPEKIVKEYVDMYYPGILEGTVPKTSLTQFIMEAIVKNEES